MTKISPDLEASTEFSQPQSADTPVNTPNPFGVAHIVNLKAIQLQIIAE